MRLTVPFAVVAVAAFAAVQPAFGQSQSSAAGEHPLGAKRRAALQKRYRQVVKQQSQVLRAKPDDVAAYSRRGDAYFFLARFQDALADYDKMVALDAKRAASHWRRGIACFYAGRFRKAAQQFEMYRTVDMVDRENGIWRFFSQAKAYGLEKARRDLLKYKKDDREPFPDVYRLFAQKITPAKIIANINAAKIGKNERAKRLFYAHLYIGLNHALQGRKKEAREHLRKAVANPWGEKAGYGPHFMWHVGRLQYELLTRKAAKRKGR